MSSIAEISHAAIRSNLQLAATLSPGCAVLLPVKANAYGHGLVEVSRMAERTGVAQWLGVAEVTEGERLRAAGIGLPILKFSGCLPDEWTAAVAAGLTLTVTDADAIAAAGRAAAALGRPTAVHLKLDTGMGRIGSPPDQAVELARLIDQSPLVELDGIFTHYPMADSAAGCAQTAAQTAAFRAAVAAVEQARGRVRWVHTSNSAGVLRGDQQGFTLIRPGIMAYGCQPNADEPVAVDLQPALRWSSRIAFRKQVVAGTQISYGGTWTAPVDTVIATVPVGYGDGFSRANSGGNSRPGGAVLVGGRVCPVVGRVCMDQTMVDLGPDATDRVGDEVVLIGRQGAAERTADQVAAVQGTISYEVLTSINERVVRGHLD